MFENLSLEEFVNLSDSHERIAVYKEIPSDRLTPTNVFLALQNKVKDVTLLESSPKEKMLGRYSFFCFDPIVTIRASGRKIQIQQTDQSSSVDGDPFDILREFKEKLNCKVSHTLAGFAGGMVGYISYDAIRLIEKIPNNNEDLDHIPDILFRFYHNHVTFDHQSQKVIVTTVASVNDNPIDSYNKAMSEIDKICDDLFSYKAENHEVLSTKNSNENKIHVDTVDERYYEMVRRAKKHISEGDIFQVVLSRNFSVRVSANPFNIYRALRFSNPSPYMFYIEDSDYAITGASPEKLITIKNKVIESCPLAGTRPRGRQDDDLLAEELLNDPKEVAEHMMLVDLARNDLGHVAIPGSVKVTKLKEIEKYTRVIHISSTVQGTLREDKDVFDAIKASFPAGTLSGAPKIRAMELIDELEKTRRGIYGGVVCGIDAQGNLDSCIAIRTAMIKNGNAYVRAGAGIVYDSNPEAEANETFYKAKAILEGILLAEGEQS